MTMKDIAHLVFFYRFYRQLHEEYEGLITCTVVLQICLIIFGWMAWRHACIDGTVG